MRNTASGSHPIDPKQMPKLEVDAICNLTFLPDIMNAAAILEAWGSARYVTSGTHVRHLRGASGGLRIQQRTKEEVAIGQDLDTILPSFFTFTAMYLLERAAEARQGNREWSLPGTWTRSAFALFDYLVSPSPSFMSRAAFVTHICTSN